MPTANEQRSNHTPQTMESWKSRLYERYVSSGKASVAVADGAAALQSPFCTQIVRSHLTDDRAIRIADLGCGYGRLVHALHEHGYNNVVGIDISREQIELGTRLGVTGIQVGDLETYLHSAAGTLDAVFLLDIVEHLTRAELLRTMDLVQAALAPGGQVIIHIPNAAGYFGSRIRYADLTHELSFTPDSMRQLLAVTGFTDVAVHEDKPIIHGPTSLIRRLLWEVLTLFPRLLFAAETGRTDAVLSQNMLVTARKTSG